jgi:PPP family 3-phenylpropionic acid transporter
LSSHFIPVLAAYTLAAIALAPVQPLGDAYALRGLRDRMRSYGSVRLWGSVTFIVANLGGGVLLAWLGAANVIWAVTAALSLNAAAALALTPLTPEVVEPASERRTRASLWRSPAFAAVMLGASLIQASHAVMYGFGTLQWSARGIDGIAIGMLWALGVVAEIVLFALSARVVGAVGATGMIVLGGAGGALRWAAMACDPPTVLLPLLQLLHALSFGATHLGSMHVLARVAPVGRNATAQGDFVTVQGIVFAAAMSGSGVLVAAFGSLAYGAMAAIAAAGGMLAAVALSRERRAPAA